MSTPDQAASSAMLPPALPASRAKVAIGVPPQTNLERLSDRSHKDLQDMLQSAFVEIQQLQAKLAASRTNATHYKVRHSLLEFEFKEAILRAEAENKMTRREVQALKIVIGGSGTYLGRGCLEGLRKRNQSLRESNEALEGRIKRAQKMINAQGGKIEELTASHDFMVHRIRTNRQHINDFRMPGGIFHNPRRSLLPTSNLRFSSSSLSSTVHPTQERDNL